MNHLVIVWPIATGIRRNYDGYFAGVDVDEIDAMFQYPSTG